MMPRKRSSHPAFSLFAFQDIITSICGIVVLITLILALELSLQIVVSESMTESPLSRTVFDQMRSEVVNMSLEVDRIQTVLSQTKLEMLENSSMTVAELRDKNAVLINDIQRNEAKKKEWEERLPQAEEFNRLSQLDEAEAKRLAEEKATLEKKIRENDTKVQMAKKGHYVYFNRLSNIKESPWLTVISDDKVNLYTLSSATASDSLDFSSGDVTSFLDWVQQRNTSREYFVLLVRPSGIASFSRIQNRLRSSGFRIGIDFISENQNVEITEKGDGP